MKPKIITEEAGRFIEETKQTVGHFYFPKKVPGTRRLVWVGIKNLPEGFRKKKFDLFRECIEWLTEAGRNITGGDADNAT